MVLMLNPMVLSTFQNTHKMVQSLCVCTKPFYTFTKPSIQFDFPTNALIVPFHQLLYLRLKPLLLKLTTHLESKCIDKYYPSMSKVAINKSKGSSLGI